MSGDVREWCIECCIDVQNPIKFEKTFNQLSLLRSQAEENTLATTCEASSEIYVSQYFKPKIKKSFIALREIFSIFLTILMSYIQSSASM